MSERRPRGAAAERRELARSIHEMRPDRLRLIPCIGIQGVSQPIDRAFGVSGCVADIKIKMQDLEGPQKVPRGLVIERIRLEEKSGGKSGHFTRAD